MTVLYWKEWHPSLYPSQEGRVNVVAAVAVAVAVARGCDNRRN
jgi:hypothetical protein